MANARIYQHQSGEALGEEVGGPHGHIATKAVRHHNTIVVETGVVQHRLDLFGEGICGVGIAVVGITHAGEIHGRNLILIE